jgi:flagellar biosynthesis protein FlhG
VPIIAIGSGKGGVGKTSAAVNLSIALAAMGLRATLVDADLGMANADVMCGIMPGRRLDQAVSGSSSTFADSSIRTLSQIAIKAPGGFTLVPGAAGVSRMADLNESERLSLLDQFAALEAESDVLLVDTGAGLSPGVTTFLAAADLTLVLATPEPTSIADAYALIKCLRSGLRLNRRPRLEAPLALVVSQARTEQEAMSVHQRIDAVSRRFLKCPVPLAGWISEDIAVGDAVRRRVPLLLSTPAAAASQDMRRLAMHLAGRLSLPVRRPAPESTSGFFARLRRVFHISTNQ